jgi:hypothetical protein
VPCLTRVPQGLEHARHELIARLDADDIIVPGRLRAQSDFLAARPDIQAVGGVALVFSGDVTTASAVGASGAPVTRVSVYPSSCEFLRWAMLFSCQVAHPAVMVRKSALRACGGCDPAVGPAE